MPAMNGKDLLIKIDMTGAGNFETVAGLRVSRFSLAQAGVEVTNAGSAGGWREILAGAGERSADISGSGVFRDEASDERVRALYFTQQVPLCQVIVPDFGVIEGPFQIASLEYAGSHNGEATFEIALRSAGELTFAPI